MKGTMQGAVVVLGLCLASTTALAENAAEPEQRVALWGSYAAGGEVVVEDSDDALNSGLGLGMTYSKPLAPNFHLGASLSFLSWLADGNMDDDRDRNLLINLGLRPEVVLPMADSIQVFAAGNLGLSYSSIGESEFLLGEIEDALGFHYGLGLGARLALKGGNGVQVELAAQRHEAEHTVDTVLGDIEADTSLEVVLLNVGYFFR